MTPTHLPGRLALPHQQRGTTLERFNTAPADEARRTLLACLHSLRWAHRLAAHRPYPTLDVLLAAADEAAYDLTAADLTEALSGEALPTLPEDSYSAAHTALGAAHTAYADKFGHVFVIYLGNVPPSETLDRVLTAIRSRLTNDPEDERTVAAEELRRLAKGRLAGLLRGPAARATSHDGPARAV
ncbi:2-oxo-4-hydroxy-4-carboxy-5-ureidoimidazoline decarboxylase [Streptomyces sp. NPDC048002]|uniref:2-oxo-4-hydroxy-4-carboxy-5-ureidoimidazoline decarboxylase n=1 Tax=unclassified Streptomyces TaxID=2593676 RepID=UPI0033CA4CE5